MKVLICGSRNWKEEDVIPEYRIEEYIKTLPPSSVIIHGDGRGADQVAKKMAIKYGHTEVPFSADWGKYGDAAGPIRNRKMLKENPNKVVAFHEDIANSKGTKDMIAAARKAGFPVEVFNG